MSKTTIIIDLRQMVEERRARKMEAMIKEFEKLLVPEYEYTKLLSTSGGFSIVLKGMNKGLEREEAIKAIDMDSIEKEGLTIEKVLQEVTMLAKLDNNHIVKVHNRIRKTTKDVDFLFVVMELCTSTLLDILKANPNGIPVEEARALLTQIVEGVAYLHSKNIIHRDLNQGTSLLILYYNSKSYSSICSSE